VAGRIDEAYQKHVDLKGKHNNPYCPAGFPALKKAMIENQVQFPSKQLRVKNVLGNGDLVAVHSHRSASGRAWCCCRSLVPLP
jgi:predicted SnoaL-like aldol condensation-catalyzing enzyme